MCTSRSFQAGLWGLTLALLPLHGFALNAVKRPVWPDAYEVAYTVELPYVASLQPTPLKYPVHIWYDKVQDSLRTSFYEGLDETYFTADATYEIYPRINTKSCIVFNHSTGPTVSAPRNEEGVLPPLPDIDDEWVYGGEYQLRGKPASHMWQLSLRFYEKVSTYTFHVAQSDGHPLHLHMVGVNLLTGSHYDQYEIDFQLFKPLVSANVFKPPALCDEAAHKQAQELGLSRAMVAQQALSLLPRALVPTGAKYGRVTEAQLGSEGGTGSLLTGLWSRMVSRISGGRPAADDSTVLENLRYIHAWNQQRAGAMKAARQGVAEGSTSPVAAADLYKMGVNKFVTWTDDAWQSTMLGRKPSTPLRKRRSIRPSALLGEYQRVLADEQLPGEVDWRGTGADGPVKDQASCGSCWAFATTGAMTAAWFKSTGQSLSFSEQQIVDCSWNYEVNGCWGGDSEPALEYIRDAGGAALEQTYPYIGQNGYCKANRTAKAAAFKGFVRVPKRDEKALMEAVALHGPLSIAFDAGHRSFKFYSEGVYYREDCGQKVSDLNHAVVLVGYGTTWNGTDYWLLRNSWSDQWGSNGYFKLARKGNDCGVSTDAVMAVVDEEAASKATA